MPSAPRARPLSNAAIVFSGARAPPPRCAKTSGRVDAKNGWSICYRIDFMAAIETLGELRRSGYRSRPVKQEIRDNLVCKLRSREALFPGIIGYDETVIPQLVNAVLSRHNFILLGLRGQAKSRILRGLAELLDERYVEKLATPDVTIADMVGDIDPIKAAQGGLNLADELTMHYGLLPRANRGIFAINELPD